MQPRYIVTTGTTPVIEHLDTNVVVFCVAIKAAAGQTVEVAVEDPDDFVAPNSYTDRVAPAGLTVGWTAAPAAVDGVITLTSPRSAVRITPTTGGTAIILQQGIR